MSPTAGEPGKPRPSSPRTSSGGPRDVGSARQLFIDHRFIESSEGIRLVVNPPVKRPGAVLSSDRPWDAFRLIWFSVAEDGGVHKMWYQAFDNDQWAGGSPRMCYAVSDDGLNWEKPRLGLVEYEGSKDNNILLEGRKLALVFIDPHGEEEQRYKMLFGYRRGMRVGTSADGIHWTLPAEPLTTLPPNWDTQKVGFWDPLIGKYVVYMRVLLDKDDELPFPFASPMESDPPVLAPRLHRAGRALGRLEMDDITSPWPDGRIETVMTADELDPPDSDIYHPGGVYQYPYAADAYFMFPYVYQHYRPGEGHPKNDGVLDCQFAAGRDGVHWMRYDRAPFIPRGLPGEPDCGHARGTGFFFRRGDYLYHYYNGWPWTHGGFRLLSDAKRQDRENWGREFMGVVVHRLDGFVSADAPYAGGRLLTPPLVFRGERLELNIDVAAMGVARVEIQDGGGRPIPGFALEDCDRILKNDVSYVARWKGEADVSALAGQPIRLRFEMRSARLYAFQFNR